MGKLDKALALMRSALNRRKEAEKVSLELKNKLDALNKKIKLAKQEKDADKKEAMTAEIARDVEECHNLNDRLNTVYSGIIF